MKKYVFSNGNEYARFLKLCKVVGLTVEEDVRWHLSSFLTEHPEPFARIMRNGTTIALAYYTTPAMPGPVSSGVDINYRGYDIGLDFIRAQAWARGYGGEVMFETGFMETPSAALLKLMEMIDKDCAEFNEASMYAE